MPEKYEYDIKKEIQNFLLNYRNRVIRSSTDYNALTIGRLQIENLDWRWQYEMSDQIKTYLEWDPWDWMSVCPIDFTRGNFVVTKYGLSYREKPLTLESYKPLWKLGTKPDQQAEIMAKEMVRMQKEGARKCENGIEVAKDSPLWNIVDALATKGRNTFRTSLGEKVKDLESRHVPYDDEKVWNAGVPVTVDILYLVRSLNNQMSK